MVEKFCWSQKKWLPLLCVCLRLTLFLCKKCIISSVNLKCPENLSSELLESVALNKI